jgi:hypothetical protein
VIVISCFDIGIVRFTPLKDKAIAMLHAMCPESVIRLFIEVIKKIWRGCDIFHIEIYKTKKCPQYQNVVL